MTLGPEAARQKRRGHSWGKLPSGAGLMGGPPQYDLEWDFWKAQDNRQKHGVSFEEAARVFLDRRAVGLFDEEHSVDEDRWITLGRVPAGDLPVVIHTFEELGQDRCRVRPISARRATARERRQYEEQR